MRFTAFILGLTAFGLASADVSHLKGTGHHQNSFGSPSDVKNYFGANNFQSSRVQQQQSCTDNSACVAPRFCLNGIIDQSYESRVSRSASRRCNGQEVCCRFAQRSANFKVFSLDSEAAPAGTSEVLTQEGYVVNKPSNKYLPVAPSYDPAPDTVNEVTVRPPTQSTTRRPTPPPTPTRPRVTYPPAPPMIPVGCSAAMNCTRLEMCTAMGIISKTPVVLSPAQQMFRVPLTECLDPQTKEQGFCCRDPDYVDPWPVGMTGQYVPDELNAVFDSGAYNPGETRVDPVRVKPETGYILPQPSNTQNRLYLPPNNRI